MCLWLVGAFVREQRAAAVTHQQDKAAAAAAKWHKNSMAPMAEQQAFRQGRTAMSIKFILYLCQLANIVECNLYEYP